MSYIQVFTLLDFSLMLHTKNTKTYLSRMLGGPNIDAGGH